MHRFMLVEHHVSTDRSVPLPVHGLLANYHWERLTATHVLVRGNYIDVHHVRLDNHPQCLLLPSHLYTNKTIQKHAHERGKEHFLEHIRHLGHQASWTTIDLIQRAADLHGTKFEL